MVKSYHIEFFTATIFKWQNLLIDKHKSIIIESLRWLVKNKRCKIYGFVIMPNHIHLLWKIEDDVERNSVQGALLNYTAHEFKKQLNNQELSAYKVNAKDRLFQFWQKNHMVKECWSEPFIEEKLIYMHNNPIQKHWKLCDSPENYYWSSSSFYESQESPFDFLTHYKE
ncbi:hypothetical protein HMPREF0765_4916 [Sphingobacterium spiritivorum ATCC 33300]|uniref:Transposase IS200-like domain-containing protein n=1 Tax=Sphingobacterium spiritivorum ATCC 33300 TaxID=525372 RepID=C2G5R0_SPHSI|nr:transposase [Sphingobacterium spiritivorum]EEI89489.1 hypothetical protein HMPREF0765_4916 [Sphingobacterium spiritivorum ATCC 33300]QQS96251.1 transposase [Sphingobacterium spiritivorum]